jgi:shikimate kinase
MRDEIVLIGPMGAGKTTLAKPLAARPGVRPPTISCSGRAFA